MDPDCLIQVKNVYKKYTKEYILRGINLSLPKGSMYGLLGPSGCGKTTLLKCILGVLDIDSGIIRLELDTHTSIGFMPQGVSLHGSLTVRECLKFYGLMFGITGKNLHKRTEELSRLLELPPLSRIIDSCSGGQQRRISLAVTLLHNPELLILDEPTVGLDPLLAQRIWLYLRDLSVTHKKTILLTTHYMEEARSLNLIGLMRGGVLLVEKPPLELIEEYNVSSLDDVFLEVIKKKQAARIEMDTEKIDLGKDRVKSTPNMKRIKNFDINHVLAQTYKNYKWMLRSLLVTLFVTVLPLIIVILAGWMFNAINISKEMIYFNEEQLFNNSCSDVAAVHIDNCKPSKLYSCSLLDIISRSNHLKSIDSLEKGMALMRDGYSHALLYIPSNFTSTIVNRMSFRLNEMESLITDETPLKLWLDNTYYHASYKAQIDIYTSLKSLIVDKCVECGIDVRLPTTTMTYRPIVVFGENSSYTSLVYPPLATGAAFYLSYIYITATMLMDITSGVLERVHVYGMTTAEMLTADSLVHLSLSIVQNILVLFGIHVLSGEVYLGSIFLMFIILILCQVSGSFVGLLTLTFDINSIGTNYIGIAFVSVLVLTTGMAWPIQGMHWILTPIPKISPFNMVTLSYSHVMQHGFSLSSPHVSRNLFGFVGYMVLVLFLLVIRVKYFQTRI